MFMITLCFHKAASFSASSPQSRQPPFPKPSCPEELVQNQLFYYQTSNLPKAFEISSPENQKAFGSLPEFERQLQIPPYDLLLNHERADVLLEIVPDDAMTHANLLLDQKGIIEVSCCLACIRPNKNARRTYPVWFWWEMSKQRQGNDIIWMVDCIMPDFEDLDFETEALSIEDFGNEGGDDDELTIFWDMDE